MELFDFFKSNAGSSRQFVTEKGFKTNSEKQIQMTPMTLVQLRKIGTSSDMDLKLEYFFYTNTNEKAKALFEELSKLDYSGSYGQSAGDKTLFVVTGWTSKMKMEDSIVVSWTKTMCDLGYKFDCEFDGWGTSPDMQE